MDEFRYSTALFPLVIVTCPRRLDAAPVRSVLDSYNKEVIEARRPFVLVVDSMNVVELPSALVRKTITDWMKDAQVVGERYMQGMALATSSAIVRAAMTAVNWVVPPTVPMAYESTLEAAVSWSITRLEAGGVGVTPAILAYRESLARAAAAS